MRAALKCDRIYAQKFIKNACRKRFSPPDSNIMIYATLTEAHKLTHTLNAYKKKKDQRTDQNWRSQTNNGSDSYIYRGNEMCQMERGAEDKGELLILECWVCFGACPLKLVHKYFASSVDHSPFGVSIRCAQAQQWKTIEKGKENKRWELKTKMKRSRGKVIAHDTHAYAVRERIFNSINRNAGPANEEKRGKKAFFSRWKMQNAKTSFCVHTQCLAVRRHE